MSRPAVSQHLRVLREAGLVAERRQGTRCYYRALPRGLGPLRQYLDRHWESVLDAFEQQARKEARRNE